MYPSHVHLYYQDPYNGEAHLFSNPFQSNIIHTADINERQFGQGFSGFSPMGMPPGQPGLRPPFGPPGQGQVDGSPSLPPPSFVPTQTLQAQTFAVDPCSIRGCLFRYTYV